MSVGETTGFAPGPVVALLRVEGLAIFVASVVAFHVVGGNWWMFAALILAPDLAFFGYLAGARAGAWTYNFAHTYAAPLAFGAIAWLAGADWALPVALIWVAHIGVDRAIGYGLKYPGIDGATHLGRIGKARKQR